MPTPILRITDGTDSVDLIGRSLHARAWLPGPMAMKMGGYRSNPPLAQGMATEPKESSMPLRAEPLGSTVSMGWCSDLSHRRRAACMRTKRQRAAI